MTALPISTRIWPESSERGPVMRQFGQGPEPGPALHCSVVQNGTWRPLEQLLSERMSLLAPKLLGNGSRPHLQEGGDCFAAALKATAA